MDEHRDEGRDTRDPARDTFLHCLVDGSKIFDVAKSRLLLSFVCSRWRIVATTLVFGLCEELTVYLFRDDANVAFAVVQLLSILAALITMPFVPV